MKIYKKAIITVIVLILLLFVYGCTKESTVENQGFVFGTFLTIKIQTKNPKKAKKLITNAFKLMKDINRNINNFSVYGDFYKINHNLNHFVKVSPTAIKLIQRTKKLYKLTDGKYDITIIPLLRLWGFNNIHALKRKHIPTKKQLAEAVKKVNFNNIIIKNNMVKLQSPSTGIDASSFLKGYGVEQAAKYLISKNVKSGLVTGVSSIFAIGIKKNGKPWEIGLENPKNPNKYIGIIYLKNGQALGVSGNFEDYLIINGKKYPHIINAKTGYPVQDVSMVVILCKNSFKADMYSTAMFLLKPKKAIKIINNTLNMQGLVVTKSGKIYYSKHMKKYFKKINID